MALRQYRSYPAHSITCLYTQDEHGAKLQITCLRCKASKVLISTDVINIETSVQHYARKHVCMTTKQS